MKWFRHLSLNKDNGKWYQYDFLACNIAEALHFASTKFVTLGIVGEIAD